MNKGWLFIFVCAATVTVFAQEQKKSSLYNLFVKQADEFVVEPSWTIPLFLKMNLKNFKQAWPFLITTITHKPERCIAALEKEYSEKKYRNTLIDQCAAYHNFLFNLFVHKKDAVLVFRVDHPVPAEYVPFFDYAKQSGMSQPLYDFYAFYFDRLAADCIECINNAALNSDHADFLKYKEQAQKTLFKLYEVYQRLYGSEYEARYGACIKNYQDIFQMLMAEKRKMESES